MFERKLTRQISVGNVKVGGQHDVASNGRALTLRKNQLVTACQV